MEETYPILECGNFYFPLLYKGKRFEVCRTITIVTDSKLPDDFNYYKDSIDLNSLASFLWTEINKNLEKEDIDKNSWIVPLRLNKFDDKYSITFDVLEEVKKTADEIVNELIVGLK